MVKSFVPFYLGMGMGTPLYLFVFILSLSLSQYNPQIVAVQECQLRKNNIINLPGFSCITKSSPGDNATGGVTLYINKSVLFSEIKLNTDLQAVAVRVSAKKTLTVCNIYLPPSLDVNFTWRQCYRR